MPKRPIAEPEFPEALAAIREALKRPRILSPDEEREFLQRRAHACIERHEYIATVRRGRLVYREHGKAGADLSVPPFYWRMLQRQRDFEAEASKVERQLAARRLYQPRKLKADHAAERIRQIATTITAGSRHKLIARAAGCSVRTVERALRKPPQPR